MQLASSAPAGGVVEEPVTPAMLQETARAVFERANAARRNAGIAPLVEVPALVQAAQEHANELATRGVLDHRSRVPGRETSGDRVTAAGATWSRVAENLASMSGLLDHVPPQTIPMWLNSPGHRTNLLEAAYTQTGVGVARAGRMTYVVQLYVTPPGR